PPEEFLALGHRAAFLAGGMQMNRRNAQLLHHFQLDAQPRVQTSEHAQRPFLHDRLLSRTAVNLPLATAPPQSGQARQEDRTRCKCSTRQAACCQARKATRRLPEAPKVSRLRAHRKWAGKLHAAMRSAHHALESIAGRQQYAPGARTPSVRLVP